MGEEALKKLQEEFSATAQELKKQVDKQQKEIDEHGQSTAETAKKIKELTNAFDDIKGELTDIEKKMQRPGYNTEKDQEPISAGKALAESDARKQFIRSGFRGRYGLDIKANFKDLDSANDSAGVLVEPSRYPDIISFEDRPMTIRDLLPASPTTSNAIEYIREFYEDAGDLVEGFDNQAEMVAEGDLKPESDLRFDKETMSVKTLAHWIPATRQIIEDAPQLQAYVDNRLLYGLMLEEEDQLLYGDGTGENLLGIMEQDHIEDAGDMAADDTPLDHIRKALTQVRLSEYAADGLVLHPSNWEEIELLKDSEDRYLWVSVTQGGQQQLWRVPVVDTTAINEDEFLVGAFRQAAMIWDRMEMTIRIAEEHDDFFARNMLAILAEERIALTVFRPHAFVKGSFTEEA